MVFFIIIITIIIVTIVIIIVIAIIKGKLYKSSLPKVHDLLDEVWLIHLIDFFNLN